MNYLSAFSTTFLFFLFLFSSCHDEKKSENKTYEEWSGSALKTLDIDLENLQIEKYSDIVNFEKFVRLETSEASLIGSIDKIIFDDSYIFVLDRDISKALFIFDDNGQFLGSLNQPGKSEAEYYEIWDFTIDKTKKEISVLDLQGRKVNYYKYDGTFVRSWKMPYLFSSHEIIDAHTLALFTGNSQNVHLPEINNYSLILSDTTGEALGKFFDTDLFSSDFSYANPYNLRKFNEHVWFHPRFSNTLFTVVADSVQPIYTLNIANDAFNGVNKQDLTDDRYRNLISDKPFFNGEFIASHDYLFAILYVPSSPVKVFYRKSDDKLWVSDKFMIDMPYAEYLDKPLTLLNDSTFVSVATATQALQLKEVASAAIEQI